MLIDDNWKLDDKASGLKLRVIKGTTEDRLHIEHTGKPGDDVVRNRDFWFTKEGKFDGTGSGRLEGFSLDEVAMLRFLELCIPSLDPDSYQNVLDACRNLCVARPKLDENSVLKCLKQVFGDDYVEPEEVVMGDQGEPRETP